MDERMRESNMYLNGCFRRMKKIVKYYLKRFFRIEDRCESSDTG